LAVRLLTRFDRKSIKNHGCHVGKKKNGSQKKKSTLAIFIRLKSNFEQQNKSKKNQRKNQRKIKEKSKKNQRKIKEKSKKNKLK
jgi:hypothetical protein